MFTLILNGLIALLVVLLILRVSVKMLAKADIEDKVERLKLVDENYEEVVKAKATFKDIEEKENEINKFTKS